MRWTHTCRTPRAPPWARAPLRRPGGRARRAHAGRGEPRGGAERARPRPRLAGTRDRRLCTPRPHGAGRRRAARRASPGDARGLRPPPSPPTSAALLPSLPTPSAPAGPASCHHVSLRASRGAARAAAERRAGWRRDSRAGALGVCRRPGPRLGPRPGGERAAARGRGGGPGGRAAGSRLPPLLRAGRGRRAAGRSAGARRPGPGGAAGKGERGKMAELAGGLCGRPRGLLSAGSALARTPAQEPAGPRPSWGPGPTVPKPAPPARTQARRHRATSLGMWEKPTLHPGGLSPEAREDAARKMHAHRTPGGCRGPGGQPGLCAGRARQRPLRAGGPQAFPRRNGPRAWPQMSAPSWGSRHRASLCVTNSGVWEVP